MFTHLKNSRFKTQDPEKELKQTIIAGIFAFVITFILINIPSHSFSYVNEAEADENDFTEIEAFVTGYNLVSEQTDSTPCTSASGKYICGRTDTITCPRSYPFGTVAEIDGIFYVCEDRTAKKYDSRWDINCDLDMACPFRVTGYKTIKVYN